MGRQKPGGTECNIRALVCYRLLILIYPDLQFIRKS